MKVKNTYRRVMNQIYQSCNYYYIPERPAKSASYTPSPILCQSPVMDAIFNIKRPSRTYFEFRVRPWQRSTHAWTPVVDVVVQVTFHYLRPPSWPSHLSYDHRPRHRSWSISPVNTLSPSSLCFAWNASDWCLLVGFYGRLTRQNVPDAGLSTRFYSRVYMVRFDHPPRRASRSGWHRHSR